MKITAWILVVVALAVLGSLGGLLLSGAERSPQDLLESAVRRTLQGDPDFDGALRELDEAFRLAKESEDYGLVGDVLVHRGRILKALDALGPARSDFRVVLDEYRPGDKSVVMELVDLDARAGDYPSALERVTDVLQRDPGYTPAWNHRGQILIRIADDFLADCERVLRSVVPAEQAAEGLALARRVTGMDLADPRRISLVHDLSAYFEPSEETQAREARRLVDLASEAVADARIALAESFAGQLTQESVHAYLGLLLRAGRVEDAIAFGLACVHHAAASGDPKTMQLIMEALTERGRAETASEAIERYLGRRVFPDIEFYRSWCLTLRRAERWRNLRFIADQMRNAAADPEDRAFADFHLGLARFELGENLQARIALEPFTRDEIHEPFPGALAEAWRMIALASRDQEDLFVEQAALYATLDLAPDADGELWLRLADLLQESRHTAPIEIERALANAIRLLPERADELLPRWRSVGEVSLRASGVQIDLLREDLRSRSLFTPATPSGPYELFRLAELHDEHGEPAGVTRACRRLLDLLPGFLPAIDMYVAAAVRLEQNDVAAALLLERLERFGNDRRTVRRIAKLPPGTLSSAQTLRLMELDPGVTGRMTVARSLSAEGRDAQALEGLLSLGLDTLGSEGNLLAGELMLRLDDHRGALDVLDDINKGYPEFAPALPLRIRAMMRVGDRGLMRKLIEEPVRPEQIDAPALCTVADRLLTDGFPRAARQVAQRLDEWPETRSGESLVRLAMASMIEGDRRVAEEALDRSDAFGRTGRPELGRVLLAIEDQAWGRLPLVVRDLRSSPLELSPLGEAAVAMLDERVEQALRLADRHGQDELDAPLWELLRHVGQLLRAEPITPDPAFGEDPDETFYALYGLGSGRRDPRPLLGHLVALETPLWSAWAVASLRRVETPSAGSLWPTFLAARGLVALDRPEDATAQLRVVLEHWPTFAPAWDLLEHLELQRLGRIDHVSLVELRKERRRHLGLRPGEEAEERLTWAWSAEVEGNLDRALRLAREAVEIDGELLPARFKLAQLNHQRERYAAAIREYQQAFAIAPERSSAELAEEFLRVLEEAHRADPDQFPRPMIRAELESLAKRLPRDPLVVLALAKEDLAAPGLSPALSVARAYRRLQDYRTATERVPVDSLRPGTARAWKDFLVALDPRRAEDFVRGELQSRPGSLDLWILLGETYEAQHRYQDAIELYETVQSMVPDGQGRRRIASLLAELGAPHERVMENVREAMRLEGREAPDKELILIQARSLFHGETPHQDEGVNVAAGVWRSRENPDRSVDPATVCQEYGTMLVHRADPDDRELAYSVLREAAERIDDAARRNLVEALANLGKQIPVRRRTR